MFDFLISNLSSLSSIPAIPSAEHLRPLSTGLIPFFIHNHLYSGIWWLPSYMERKVLALGPALSLPRLAQVGNAAIIAVALLLAVMTLVVWQRRKGGAGNAPADSGSRRRRLLFFAVMFTLSMIVLGVLSQKFGLVPGMKFSRFWPGLVKTWGYLFRKIGWRGLLLALFGIGYASRKKYYPFLIIYGMSACTFLWFWSHYRYVKPRYVFAVELFLYPLVAVGLWGLFALVALAAKPGSLRRSLPHLATWALTLLAASRFSICSFASWVATETSRDIELESIERIIKGASPRIPTVRMAMLMRISNRLSPLDFFILFFTC